MSCTVAHSTYLILVFFFTCMLDYSPCSLPICMVVIYAWPTPYKYNCTTYNVNTNTCYLYNISARHIGHCGFTCNQRSMHWRWYLWKQGRVRMISPSLIVFIHTTHSEHSVVVVVDEELQSVVWREMGSRSMIRSLNVVLVVPRVLPVEERSVVGNCACKRDLAKDRRWSRWSWLARVSRAKLVRRRANASQRSVPGEPTTKPDNLGNLELAISSVACTGLCTRLIACPE